MTEQRDLDDFVVAAERYCTLIEGVEGRARADVLFDLGIVLPALYAASLRLPVRYSETETPEKDRPDHGYMAGPLESVLGDHGGDEFWSFVNMMDGWSPSKNPKKRRTELPPHSLWSLVDALSNIHLLLREGLYLQSRGAEDEAVWEWQQDWFSWGHYVVNSLLTVHACLVAESARGFVRGGPNFPVAPEG